MEWYQDSIACLDVAKTMLTDVEGQQIESIYNSDVIPYLKVSIKNTLENCRSPLDYVANYINANYPKYSSKFKRPQFPILYSPKNAEYNIKQSLICSPEVEIINIIKDCQINKDWLKDLTKLVNLNKHNNLTHHDTHNESYIEYMNIDGIQISNAFFSGNEVDIQIGDKSYTGPEMLDIHPGVKGNFTRTYYFKDINNKEVKQTLQTIINETEIVIHQLYKYLV